MINILIPLAGEGKSFKDAGYLFPKSLIEIQGKPMIQYVIENLRFSEESRFIFATNESDTARFSLPSVLGLLTKDPIIINLQQPTAGAATTALLAIDYINNDDPLIIANGDQFLFEPLDKILTEFRDRKLDGGIITFESVHPRWSYAKVNEQGLVVETAEKRPISRHATVGIYYFAHGRDFVESAKRMILNAETTNGQYYIAPAYNQMVLNNKKIGISQIARENFYSLGTPADLSEFEKRISDTNTFQRALDYSQVVSKKDLFALEALFADNISIIDPLLGKHRGRAAALDAYRSAFNQYETINLQARNVIINRNNASLQFTIFLDGTSIEGVDLITFDTSGKIVSLHGYIDSIPK